MFIIKSGNMTCSSSLACTLIKLFVSAENRTCSIKYYIKYVYAEWIFLKNPNHCNNDYNDLDYWLDYIVIKLWQHCQSKIKW